MDLLVLTFNCAKNLIDVGVFAGHLREALGDVNSSSELPDIVVL